MSFNLLLPLWCLKTILSSSGKYGRLALEMHGNFSSRFVSSPTRALSRDTSVSIAVIFRDMGAPLERSNTLLCWQCLRVLTHFRQWKVQSTLTFEIPHWPKTGRWAPWMFVTAYCTPSMFKGLSTIGVPLGIPQGFPFAKPDLTITSPP
jgi:hypothetical protein